MGNLAVGFKQIYSGVKTIFGCGGARKAVQQAAKPVYHGPTLSDMAAKMPLALPAPTAEALAAARPRVNVAKVLNGRNLDELRMSQVITKNGTHVRYYRGAESDKILLKTADKGLLHQEWVYGRSPEELTYIKTIGGDRYIMKREGNLVQMEKRSIQYKDGINQTVSTNDLYFNDGAGNGFHRRDVKGFNGNDSKTLEIRDHYTVYPGREYEKVVPYHIKNTGLGRDENRETQKFLSDLYYKYGCDIGESVTNKIREVMDTAKTRFISDFDEALFSAYKA